MPSAADVRGALARDPTQTATIRRKMVRSIGRRYRKLMGAIIKELERWPADPGPAAVNNFMEWLEQAMLDTIERDPEPERRISVNVTEADAPAWLASIMGDAEQRGIQQAVSDVAAAAGEDFRIIELARREAVRNRHAAVLARTMEEIRGVNAAARTQIRRILADAIAEGVSPRVAATRINDRVRKVGMTRAKRVARTEIIRAHHKAKIGSFEAMGVEGVEVQAEFSTAADGDVCEECAGLEGRVYKLSEAENMIPVHPNCRCTLRPYFRGMETRTERRDRLRQRKRRIRDTEPRGSARGPGKSGLI